MNQVDEVSNIESLKTVTILIVEDEYILAANLRESLEAFGYTVLDIVDSAEMAIEKAAELRPRLILMDIWLRGEMDGVQAAEQIWHQLQIPIIYVTGYSDRSTVERATFTSPFGYVLKPIRNRELYAAIQTALTRYEREQFLGTVLKQMADGVVVVDTQLRIKYLNRVAEGMTGWQFEEVKERAVTEIIRFIDEQTQQIADHPIAIALQQKTPLYLNRGLLLVTRSGVTLPIADSVASLQDSRGEVTGAVMVFRDDTQRRLLEERNLAAERAHSLEVQMAELERLNRLKDDFLATTSHELRTPLSNIKLAIHMLELTLNQQGVLASESSATEAVSRYLKIARDQCDQELKIVSDLLDLRSIDANAYPLELAPISVEDWLFDLVEGFQERITAQHQTLRIEVAPELPAFVSDLSILTRIFSELLNNACKYTPAYEQIEISVQLAEPSNLPAEMPQSASQPLIQFVVKNSGIQLEPEELPQLFEPFHRVTNNDPWKYGGTGLGLALVKKLVEHLQGRIQVASAPSWLIFTVFLPLSLTGDDAVAPLD